MTDEEFGALLDCHGADLTAWPAAAARGAQRLLARSAAARALLDEAVGIELALAASENGAATGPPADLAERIFDKAFGAAPPAVSDASGDRRPPRAG